MPRNFLLAIFFCLLFPSLFFAQGEANNWYFGVNAGVTFNTPSPSALTHGKLNTNEGCSSISDENGNLLFYTDGRTIWNRNHQIMANADYYNGTGLLGDPSSTSSGLIVPSPANPNIYYVFTVDEPHQDNAAAYPSKGPANQDGKPTPDGQYTDFFGANSNPSGRIPFADDGYNNGFNYSVVDMRLNGGLGDVVPNKHNKPLLTYDPTNSEQIKYKCAEKITAVKGADCNSFWVITQFVDTFYAFKIDANGLNTTAVTSKIGPTIPLSAYRRAAIGYLKASPDGKKLLIAHNTKTFDPVTGVDGQDGGVYLFDFNDQTGKVSNMQALIEDAGPYGVEFSMKSKKAYASVSKNNQLKILQWNLESNDIPASKYSLPGVSATTATALQLAPNGKIYMPLINTPYLAVINHPELNGSAVDYSEKTSDGAIKLATGYATFGLPPFIQSIFSSRINIVDDSKEIKTQLGICAGNSHALSYKNIPGATYTWSKDGTQLKNQPAPPYELFLDNPPTNNTPATHTFKLAIDRNDGSCPLIGIAQVTFGAKLDVKPASLSECSFKTPDASIFDLTDAETQLLASKTIKNYRFEYTNPSTNKSIEDAENFINSSNPQTLDVHIIDKKTGCMASSTLTLKVTNNSVAPVLLTACPKNNSGVESFDLTKARAHLKNQYPQSNIFFYPTQKDAALQKNKINNEADFQNKTPFNQTLYARIDASEDCSGITEIRLKVEDYLDLGPDQELIYCKENYPQKINLRPPNINNPEAYTYFWQPNGETTQSIQVNKAGQYTVEVTNKKTGCSVDLKYQVVPSTVATFQVNIEDLAATNTLNVTLSDKSLGNYEFALDDESGVYQDSPIFEHVKSGKHKVFVRDKNGCGISGKTVHVLGFMKFFTPNNDGYNDHWKLLGSTEENLNGTTTTIFDRYGKTLHQFHGNFSGWNGIFNGHLLPSNEYWFLMKYKDGTEFKGHFTLKR